MTWCHRMYWWAATACLLFLCQPACSRQPAASQTCKEDGTCTRQTVTADPSMNRQKAYDFFLAGNELYGQGDLTGAVREYHTALEHDPTHADTLCNLASALQELGDYDGAVDHYMAAVEHNPYHHMAHFNLGLLLHDADVETAIEHYQAAVESDPMMADAWSNLGSAYHGEQEYESAIRAYQEAIDLFTEEDPDAQYYGGYLSTLHYNLGQALASLPDDRCADGRCTEHAVEALRKVLRLDPDNALAQHSLSSLLEDPNVASASPAYVRRLFDDYAATFDESLYGLGYQAPTVLRQILADRRPGYGEVMDAGCGTGLCGPLFRNMSETLVGVDLSQNMVEVARTRDVYDELLVGEIAEEMQGLVQKGRSADLVVAADVFVYSGNLSDIFASTASYLRPRGLFAFTVERLEPEDCTQDEGCRGWKLLLSGRFAHTRSYIEDLAAAHGFLEDTYAEIVPRLEGGKPVPGQLFVFEQYVGVEIE